MAAVTLPVSSLPSLRRPRPLRWRRVLAAVVAMALLTGIDTAWKLTAVVAGRGALDTPGDVLKPIGTMIAWLLVLGGVLILPSLCVPATVLLAGGIGSNLFSLALWHAAPNPLSVHLGSAILHFNLADTCVAAGGILLVLSVLATPAERFD